MEKSHRILIVEDEEAIRTGLVDVFVYHGYEVVAEADGRRGLEQALSGRYDLVLLDVMLPTMNGFEICDAIRQSDRALAIIMLTAKVSDEDIVNGLRLGADDYVGKPFGIQELVLRVEAVLRRTALALPAGSLDLGNGLTIDPDNLSGMRGNSTISFTCREIELLQYLYAQSTRSVSRDELLHHVWGYRKNLDIETRTVDIHIAKLRRKIEDDPKVPCRLITVRGAGYRLVVSH